MRFFRCRAAAPKSAEFCWDSVLKRRLAIADYVALDCEHAFGPSFALSPRDQDRLAELLASAEQNPDRLRPVGWYHSHTRSEIFLSEADQDLHNRYFPEPWQVALVLKPHTFHPTRAGFFFRETDGSIHGTASYQEFALAPLPVRPVPAGVAPATESAPSARLRRGPDPPGPVITVAAEQAAPEPAPPAEPGRLRGIRAQPADLPLPSFLAPPAERKPRWFVTVLAIAIGLAVAVAGYQTPAPLAAWPDGCDSARARAFHRDQRDRSRRPVADPVGRRLSRGAPGTPTPSWRLTTVLFPGRSSWTRGT